MKMCGGKKEKRRKKKKTTFCKPQIAHDRLSNSSQTTQHICNHLQSQTSSD